MNITERCIWTKADLDDLELLLLSALGLIKFFTISLLCGKPAKEIDDVGDVVN